MQKFSQDAADADFTIGCDSAPLHPVRCPVHKVLSCFILYLHVDKLFVLVCSPHYKF